jgi:hypothetical protein
MNVFKHNEGMKEDEVEGSDADELEYDPVTPETRVLLAPDEDNEGLPLEPVSRLAGTVPTKAQDQSMKRSELAQDNIFLLSVLPLLSEGDQSSIS